MRDETFRPHKWVLQMKQWKHRNLRQISLSTAIWISTPTEQESAAHELSDFSIIEGCSGNDRADGDNKRADAHAPLAAPSIDSRTDERKCNDTTNLIHGRDNASPDTCIGSMEERFELWIGE